MATASVTNTFVNAATADADDVNTNFSDLVTFLNASVVHVDGSKAFTAVQTGVAPTSDLHLSTKKYVDDKAALAPLVAGTRAFTGVQSGVTPTADAHLATKGYVDHFGSGARATLTAGENISNAAWDAIAWDAVTETNVTFWSAGAPTRLTIPSGAGGWYIVEGGVYWATAGTGGTERRVGIWDSGSALVAATYNEPWSGLFQSVTAICYLSAADYVDLRAYQDSGGVVACSGSVTHLSIARLGD
jgi:hypothetical protein